MNEKPNPLAYAADLHRQMDGLDNDFPSSAEMRLDTYLHILDIFRNAQLSLPALSLFTSTASQRSI